MNSPPPRRGCVLSLFYTLNLVTIIVALCVAASLIIELAISSIDRTVEILIRLYGIFFSIAIVFIELEWPAAVRDSIFNSWPLRGILYSFIGLLAMEFSNFDENDFAKFYDGLVGWVMVGVGLFYFILGLLCMKRVRDRKLTHYHAVCAARAVMEEAASERQLESKIGMD